MSVSPLSRGPRTLTEGDVLAVAAALAPTVGGSIRIPADATPPVD